MSSSTPATTTDAGSDTASSNETGTAQATDHGVVMDYGNGKALGGITVAQGGVTATTDDKGQYSMKVPANTPMQMVLTGPSYTRTILGELSIASDIEREVNLPQITLFHVGQSALDGYDTSKGIVYLLVRPTGSCTSVDGGTVKVNAPADAKFAYFVDKLPDMSATSMKANASDPENIPQVAVYNVPVGQQIDVTITHPTCKQAAFPVTVKNVTYTGKVNVEAGDANSVAFYYLQ